jgi:glycosyltransferase involved in cell wall biosynthesis
MPLVSVIIPSYNCAKYLPESIESVLGQSFGDFEIILVDDGSTDDTKEVVNRYLGDRRLRYVFQENRGVPSIAKNRGVAIARGEFIATLDADDILAPTALEEMTAALQGSNASWCIIDVLKFWEDYREVRRTQFRAADLLHELLQADFICRAMFFWKAALVRVGMWDEALRTREDWDLNIRLMASGEPFAYLNMPLYHYRHRPGSLTTANSRGLLLDTERLLRKHHKPRADAGDTEVAKIYAARMWDLARSHFFRTRDLAAVSRCVWESAMYDFSLARLIHPLVHHAKLCLAAIRRMTTAKLEH